MDDRGELTDDDRRARRRALRPARGRGLRRLHLLRRPARSRAASATSASAPAPPASPPTGDAHVDASSRDGLGLELGERSADGSVSLAETVCLGFCHSSPAVRVGDVIDAGPGRGRAGARRRRRVAAAEPESASLLAEPVLTRPGDWSGLRRALAELDARGAARGGQGGRRARPRRRRLPGRAPSGSSRAAPRASEKFIVANGDEGDPGSYIDKYLMERNPALLLEGMALAGYAVGAEPRLRAHPLASTRARSRALEAAVARRARQGCSATTSSAAASTSTSRSSRAPAPTWSARRRRCCLPAGAARHGLGAAAVPRRSAACTACRPWSTTSRRSATSPSSPPAAPTPTARSAPARDAGLEARLLQRALRAARASTRSRSA